MGVLSKDKKLIRLYFNSKKINDKEVRSYLKASNSKLFTIDIAHEKVTELQWHEILDGLGMKPLEIMDDSHPLFSENSKIKAMDSYSKTDWVTIICNNPDLLNGTIVTQGDETCYFETPKSVIKYLADTTNHQYDKRS